MTGASEDRHITYVVTRTLQKGNILMGQRNIHIYSLQVGLWFVQL